MITIPQIKAARAMLGYSQQDLANKAGVSVATLNNIERGAQTDPKLSTISAIRTALEVGGIEFTDEQSGGVGVRLRALPKNPSESTILIIDDNHADRLLFKRWLNAAEKNNYYIIEASDAKAGFESFIEYNPDCIILDFMMYGMDGFQLLAEMKKDYPVMPPIIFVTGIKNEGLVEKVKQQQVHAYFDKNTLTEEKLQTAVESALHKKQYSAA